MCVHVVIGDIDPNAPLWNRPNVEIVVGRGATQLQAVTQVRTLLKWLGARQWGVEPRCWCGDPVDVRLDRLRYTGQLEDIRHA